LEAAMFEGKGPEPDGSPDIRLRYLKNVALLNRLPGPALRRVALACEWRDVASGDHLIDKGDTGDEVFFLVAGRVRVLNFAISGRVVAYASLEPGSYFGELAAIDGRSRSATVVAEQPSTVAVVQGKAFKAILAEHPSAALCVMERLANVIRSCDERIFDLTTLSATQRICLELMRLAESNSAASDHAVVNPLPKQELLATNAGTTRETVVRVFKRLTEKRIITKERGALLILARSSLESLIINVDADA
jgi:CRP/FNR family transcriptional regulator, cyclic AMP receptor protein